MRLRNWSIAVLCGALLPAAPAYAKPEAPIDAHSNWTIHDFRVDGERQGEHEGALLQLDGDRYVIYADHDEVLDHGHFKQSAANVRMRSSDGSLDLKLQQKGGTLQLAGTLSMDDVPILRVKFSLRPEPVPPVHAAPFDLLQAASLGDVAAIQQFLAAGEDVSKRGSSGETPLMLAAVNCHPSAVTVLLQHGANVEDKWSFNGDTPLLRAASCGDEDTVRAVLAAHPKLTAKRKDRTTALMQVVRSGELGAAKALVAAGASLHDRDEYGNTLLHEAAGGRGFANTPCVDFVRWLLDQKLDVNARGLSDNTPLMAAIVGKQRDAIKLLLAAGADRSLRNAGDVDAVELAKREAPKLLPLLRGQAPAQNVR